MIFNDEEIEIAKVEAFYIVRKHSADTYIKITSKKGQSIDFTFNDEEIDPRLLEKNKKINLVPHLFWDVELITKDSFYLFDLSKDKIELTRLDDNLFKIEVNIENPNMIYSPLVPNASFKNLLIETEFSFVYEDK